MEPTQRTEIISAYGNILENRGITVGRESDLPFPKELIRQALSEELLSPLDPKMLNALEVGFLELESFLSDEEFELVKQFEQSVADARKIMQSEDLESIKKAKASIAQTPDEVLEIQQRIIQCQKHRLKQIQNMREIRSQRKA